MKKLLLVLLLCGFAYPQQIDTVFTDSLIIITEIPEEIIPIVTVIKIEGKIKQYLNSRKYRDEFQMIMDRLEWVIANNLDALEYYDGYNPIETATEWRIKYIRNWLKDYNVDYPEEATRDELLIIVENFLNL